MRRIPIIPTLVVLAAVAVMIALGVWQLGRMEEKEALIERYGGAQGNQEVLEIKDWPLFGPEPSLFSKSDIAYRRIEMNCLKSGDEQLVAGHNADRETGWAHAFRCKVGAGEGFTQIAIVIGWSKEIRQVDWKGGAVTGTLVPGRKPSIVLPEVRGTSFGSVHNADYHIVADPPLAGLEPNARPDPRNIPNNHWSYAAQWFLFALTALVIYALALRKRLRGQ